jgi:uncharacterized repeat protein (TIGR01451 family)
MKATKSRARSLGGKARAFIALVITLSTQVQNYSTTQAVQRGIDNIQEIAITSKSVEQQAGTISGFAWRDYNSNGVRDTLLNEPGIGGVTVRAVDEFGNTVNATTSFTGDYSLASLPGNYARVEFTLPSNLYFLESGGAGGTSVQFVNLTGGSVTGVNAGFNNPSDYCQANARLCVPNYRNGSGVGNTWSGLVSMLYNTSDGSPAYGRGDVPLSVDAGVDPFNPTAAPAPEPRQDAMVQEVGTVWGNAYQRDKKRLFLSAFLKRHAGFGPQGPGGIYVLDYSDSTRASMVTSFTLEGVSTVNGGTIQFGSVTRTGTDDYTLPPEMDLPNRDLDAFAKIGKMSMGDLDVSEDEYTLWAVNLFQRAVIRMDLRNFDPAIHKNNTLPANSVNQFVVANIPGAPTCTGGELRPWALAFRDRVGYLGVVCDAESSQSITNLRAMVLSFNPDNILAGFTTELNFPLGYTRENNGPGLGNLPDTWRPWARTWVEANLPQSDTTRRDVRPSYPQPILTDIEIASDNSLILGFRDRLGDQVGYANFPAISGSTFTLYGMAGGDIVHACKTSTGYVIEGSNCLPQNLPAGWTPRGPRPRQDDGPNGLDEFYFEDVYYMGLAGTYGVYHAEVILGGLAVWPGSGEIVATVNDPVDWPIAANGSYRALDTIGLHWYDTLTGTMRNSYIITHSISAGAFGKSNGLGDLEILCESAPLELGNRVWYDKNKNGIQDPDEPPIPNVRVQLYVTSTNTPVGEAYTNAKGEYYFKDGIETAQTITDHIGLVNVGIQHFTPYSIVIEVLQASMAGFTPTLSNGDGITSNIALADVRDSDVYTYMLNATSGIGGGSALAPTRMIATIPYTTGGPGQNNHSLDFGFRSLEPDMAFVKLLNGQDANTAPGPVVLIGSVVTFTYIVTNTGEVSLTNLSLYDNKLGVIPSSACSLSATDILPMGASATCVMTSTAVSGQYSNTAVITMTRIPVNPLISSPPLTRTDIANYYGSNASVSLIKLTNGKGGMPEDADNMPGPYIGAGLGVTWTYLVTNTGAITLVNLSLVDDVIGAVTCPVTTLAPYAGTVCYATGVAIVGQYTNTGVVSATTPPGSGINMVVTSTNPSHYYGIKPELTVIKLTNGQEARSGTGPIVLPGSAVTWTYRVTNTGNVTMTNIALTDDKVGAISCPLNVLSIGAGMTCTATGTAIAGQYINQVTVTGTNPITNGGNITPTVVKTDTSRYIGADPRIVIVKLTNGQDVSAPTGPVVAIGSPVTWTYRITNTGTVTLTNIVLSDSREGNINPSLCAPSLSGLQLSPGASITCNLVGTAQTGQYSNTATVTATNPYSNGGVITPTVVATDTSFYIGYGSGIGDFVWLDTNRNGLYDTGEVGVPDVRVQLFNADTNVQLAVTTTNASGYYSFVNLPPGRYYVVFTSPSGYAFTIQGASDGTRNSDPDPTTGRTPVVTLGINEFNPNIDAGLWQPLTIGNQVWFDANNDGIFNPNEVGLRNVLLELYEDTNADGRFEQGTDRLVGSTQTDSTGKYQFNNLVPGTYFVVVPAANFTSGSALAALRPSTDAVDGNSNLNNRNHGIATGVLGSNGYVATTAVTLVAGQGPIDDGDTDPNTNLTIDLGFNDNNPSAVLLTSFVAERYTNGETHVKWVTALEIDTQGFYVYRSEGPATSSRMPATAQRITPDLILGRGRGAAGASYEWVDKTGQNGKVYTYWLVELETSGSEIGYGPASAIFKAGTSKIFVPLIIKRAK